MYSGRCTYYLIIWLMYLHPSFDKCTKYLTKLVLIQFSGSLLCVANGVLATDNDEDTQLQVAIKLKVSGCRLDSSQPRLH